MNKKIFVLISLLLSCFLFSTLQASGASQSGCILSIKGEVCINRNGEWKTPYLTMGVLSGDIISIKSIKTTQQQQSYIVIAFYQDGHMEYITTPSNTGQIFYVKIQENKAVSYYGKGDICHIDQTGTIKVAGSSQISQKIGGSVGRNLEKGVPVKSFSSLSEKPLFTWKGNNKHKYIFEIKDIYTEKTTENKLAYKGVDLEKGKTYEWSVKDEDTNTGLVNGEIYILTEDEVKSVNLIKEQVEKQLDKNPSDITPYKFMGNYLIDMGLFQEALEYYKKGNKINKEDKELSNTIKTLEEAWNK